jgi:benzoyl-CoA reductase/2-hydroxyglutaryl-CoA dehydratase subunit BcrC/BadD/HgdB
VWDVLVYLKFKPFCHIMHLPFVDSKLSRQYLKEEIVKLISASEEFNGVKITEKSLRQSIETYNQWRKLLEKIYELRKRPTPPLSGAETLGLTTASTVMPKDYFNQELEALFPYLETRQAKLRDVRPRLLIESDMLDHPAYLSLVEDEGCLIAMDDMDTGIRLFAQEVDTSATDLTYALAESYLSRHGVARMSSWDKQAEQLIRWVSEYSIDGVLALPLAWCYPQRYRMPFLARKLEQAGIPFMSIEREYHLANTGQIKTRVGAFLEVIRSQLDNKPGGI